ncbi:nuclear transport factor 2 family protein [Herbiconiux sp. P15]|uniref:nuclear transport factor 2 family protein n=1 Tax=Herbiconiux liukaitaii TaxID=3342799 RepID=UPI0035B7DD4C
MRPGAEDRIAIADLLSSSMWSLDTRDLELYLGTYWPDADFSEVGPDGVRRAWQGIDDIRDMTTPRFGGPTGRQHRLSNHVYTPLPAHAGGAAEPHGWTVWSYWMTTTRHPESGEVVFEMSGFLRDEVEERHGEWRLVGRHLDGWPDDLVHPLRAAP